MAAVASEKLCHHYTLAKVLLATQNFDERLVVGRGGSAKVYKGHLKTKISSNTTVAIKRMDSSSDQGALEFRAEINMVCRLRHSHLVSLLGCCVEGKKMILVYDYMPNGTLYHHLHHSNIRLPWIQRLKIGIGAARGLEYLHTGTGTKHGVIHSDVKTTNILLDEDWAAKIADFGLAKICPTNQSSTHVSTRVKGTFGYLDPEFYMTGKLTRKTDVFAFGVVLFELVSGRHAVLPEGDEDLSFSRWAQKCVKKRNLDQLVASELRGKVSPKSLKEFAKIANRCLHSDPDERPRMSDVVVALQLSLDLQKKFDNCTKRVGLFNFTWKMPNNFVLETKNSGHGDKKSSNNSKNRSDCSPEPMEDGGDYNEQILTEKLKIFKFDDLECATGNFQNQLSVHRTLVFIGWVHKKTYSPSKSGVGLGITVEKLLQRPEIKKDLQLLGEFTHPNLQRVLGYCLKDGILYLVREFMDKISLFDSLQLYTVTIELTFSMRVKIVVGVARGLVFLQSKRLTIRDWVLNTDEIGVDKDFNAKVVFLSVATSVSQVKQSPLKGYLYDGRRCDVYGLLMLLMDVLVGNASIHKTRQLLSCNAADLSDTMIMKLVDPRMTLNASQIERVRELFSLILSSREHHYTMTRALKELENIYSKLKAVTKCAHQRPCTLDVSRCVVKVFFSKWSRFLVSWWTFV